MIYEISEINVGDTIEWVSDSIAPGGRGKVTQKIGRDQPLVCAIRFEDEMKWEWSVAMWQITAHTAAEVNSNNRSLNND